MADMDESDIPKEVPASEDYMADPENKVRGLKAAISNPRMLFPFLLGKNKLSPRAHIDLYHCTEVSQQAKQSAKKTLESYDEPYDASSATHGSQQQSKDPGNVARGLKASMTNEGVSEEAKSKAKMKLDALG